MNCRFDFPLSQRVKEVYQYQVPKQLMQIQLVLFQSLNSISQFFNITDLTVSLNITYS